MFDVVIVASPSNKSKTWRFKSLKKAIKFVKSLKDVGEPGYYVLCFTLQS